MANKAFPDVIHFRRCATVFCWNANQTSKLHLHCYFRSVQSTGEAVEFWT